MFHMLPEAGGLRTQPYRLMLGLSRCLIVFRAVSDYEKAKAGERAKWKADHPDLVEYLKYGNHSR